MPNSREPRIEGMKKTLIKSEEQEQPKGLGDFEQFVKNLLSVPKEEVDELIRKERQENKEQNPDLLEKKKPNK